MSLQFDLEQKIMQCWSVVEDIEHYLHAEEKLTEDERQNFLIGLKTIYQVKFDSLFGCFEQYVKENHDKQTSALIL